MVCIGFILDLTATASMTRLLDALHTCCLWRRARVVRSKVTGHLDARFSGTSEGQKVHQGRPQTQRRIQKPDPPPPHVVGVGFRPRHAVQSERSAGFPNSGHSPEIYALRRARKAVERARQGAYRIPPAPGRPIALNPTRRPGQFVPSMPAVHWPAQAERGRDGAR
jgi:hypothetical protein